MYVDGFSDKADIAKEFSIPETDLADCKILFAAYTYESYSGSALVVFEKDGKLFEVNGGHCSCYGLEGQWEPEETSWEALAMRDKSWESYGEDFNKFLALNQKKVKKEKT